MVNGPNSSSSICLVWRVLLTCPAQHADGILGLARRAALDRAVLELVALDVRFLFFLIFFYKIDVGGFGERGLIIFW